MIMIRSFPYSIRLLKSRTSLQGEAIRKATRDRHSFDRIIGKSKVIQKTIEIAKKVSDTGYYSITDRRDRDRKGKIFA